MTLLLRSILQMSLLVVYAKALARKALGRIVRWGGMRFLSKAQTLAYLSPYERGHQPAQQLALPAVYDALNPTKLVFDHQLLTIEPTHVWQHPQGKPTATLLRSGNLLSGGQVLCTDFYNGHAMRDALLPQRRRRVVEAATLVAPFGHYQHPVRFWGYYDFLFLVAAKLCRILEAEPTLVPAQAVVAYPLLGTAYEQELLAAVGFQPAQQLDSRLYDVKFADCLLGNCGDWQYPSPTDVQLLQRRLAPLIQPTATPQRRIYVSRTGRRRIVNEDALVAMLKKYDFAIIEDKPRTLVEQLSLYHGASFVMGPHGASFSNVIWCKQGTQLYEIFPSEYTPRYFQYLAQLAGLKYAAICQETVEDKGLTSLEKDIRVSVSDLERSLNRLLEQVPAGH